MTELEDMLDLLRAAGWGVRGGDQGTPITDSAGLIETPREPLFLRFAVPKEWRTKDSGTA